MDESIDRLVKTAMRRGVQMGLNAARSFVLEAAQALKDEGEYAACRAFVELSESLGKISVDAEKGEYTHEK